MGFQTPKYELKNLLEWTTSGKVQLPDFQRGYKWEDERIRQLLVTILRGHPLGVVMMLEADNENVRFKPRPIEGVNLKSETTLEWLLLDGQQRLTSLTQALTGDGIVATKDSRGKFLERRYYLDIAKAFEGDDSTDDAVISIPGDGKVRSNFGKDIDLDVSTEDLERERGYFPLRLLYDPYAGTTWLSKLTDISVMPRMIAEVLNPAGSYSIPAIVLDDSTSKAAVATVFEKVNIGGLPLNVFELLTAVYAGDVDYYKAHGDDFRLNDDWAATKEALKTYPVLAGLENTDFLQTVSLLASLHGPAATTARKEDILNLKLAEYLKWAPKAREALVWVAGFLDALHIHVAGDLPYPKQIVPLAAIKVVLGNDADVHGVHRRLQQWFWCGVLGELYGGAIESRFARDVEQVPTWVRSADNPSAVQPKTIEDANFFESRLHSMRTRNSAAYKGVYALLMAKNTRDWMFNQPFSKADFLAMQVDIHHIFPKAWCAKNGIDDERRESIVNKTPMAKKTNIRLGGNAPSLYIKSLESVVGIPPSDLDKIIADHEIDVPTLRADDFDAFFNARREALSRLIEDAIGKRVARESAKAGVEGAAAFEAEPEDPDDTSDDEPLAEEELKRWR
ncbi:hypothetical protein A5746_20665 [Mycolicibacterium conceptionense]|uniref:DUF262 domain-containing protein n=1 Tax=Mycolicibacterium conceptionense TaxID=451644 RepID=UPI0007ED8BBB|nr:DUF262 domain-containing protein [Mycolicibacterium conceptionense]OBK03535.1 hypothetical protein A5639_22735 [Mycolicibacterium conceptionense]OMB68864.1 hypothetical protein A5741_09380 [Mycolicibacterium conceptionense]OMB91169.1 hypothetical protein A5746_20665 [Mycolicibacterium conceptionense]